jgi:hypothetical protein
MASTLARRRWIAAAGAARDHLRSNQCRQFRCAADVDYTQFDQPSPLEHLLGSKPCRRDTADIEASGRLASFTIASFCSVV